MDLAAAKPHYDPLLGLKESNFMGVLVIKWPTMGREFSTGIQTDWDTLTRMHNNLLHSHGPHCKSQHSWRPDDAKVVDAIPPTDWIENQYILTVNFLFLAH
jgi:hypothetical protein